MQKRIIGKREGDFISSLFLLLARCQEGSTGATGTRERKTRHEKHCLL